MLKPVAIPALFAVLGACSYSENKTVAASPPSTVVTPDGTAVTTNATSTTTSTRIGF